MVEAAKTKNRCSFGAFGGAWLAGADAVAQRPRSGTQAQILAYLIMHNGERVSWSALGEAIWPDNPDESSRRNNLRVHVSNLRRWVRESVDERLAERIVTYQQAYSFEPDGCGFDVNEFEDTIRSARAAVSAKEFDLAESLLAHAEELWAEPYLELEDHFDAESERTRLKALFDFAVEERLEVAIKRGDAAQVLPALESRIITNPYREQCYSQLMRAYFFVGRQADALGVYQTARRRLVNDLGIEPSKNLVALEAHVLAQTLPEANVEKPVQQRQETTRDSLGTRHFFGRQSELAAVINTIKESKTAVIFGEPGIGKTRLISEARHVVSDHVWMVSRSYQNLQAPPLWEIRRQVYMADDEDTSEVVDSFGYNNKIIERLEAVAAETPVVVVFDDFQWADQATRGFVFQLAMFKPQGLSLLIATRDARVDLDGETGELIAEVTRLESTARINIGPLQDSEVSAMIEQAGFDRETSAAIGERAFGNPLYITQSLSSGADKTHVPESVTHVTLSRLRGVSESLRNGLCSLACVGAHFGPAALAKIMDTSVEEISRIWDCGVNYGLLVRDQETNLVDFKHVIVKEALQGRVPSAEQLVLHDRAAEYLIERNGTSRRLVFGLAYHAYESLPLGPVSRAVSALREAGKICENDFAFQDAVEVYLRAEKALEFASPVERTASVGWVLSDLGHALLRSGRTVEGKRALEQAIDHARKSEDSECFVLSARRIAEAGQPQANLDINMVEAVSEAVEMCDGVASENLVQLLVDLAGYRFRTHGMSHRKALCDQALAMAEELDDKARAIARIGTWGALYSLSTSQYRYQLAVEARIFAKNSGALNLEIVANTFIACYFFEIGDIGAANQAYRHAETLLRTVQSERLRWFVLGWAPLFSIAKGDFEKADQASHEALAIWNDGNHEDALAAYGVQQLQLAMLCHDIRRARGIAELAYAAEHQQHGYIKGFEAATTMCQVFSGEKAAIERFASEVDQALEIDIDRDVTLVFALYFYAETAAACAGLGWYAPLVQELGGVQLDCHPGLLIRLADKLGEYSEMCGVVTVFGVGGMFIGSLEFARGLALAAAGRFDSAYKAFKKAEQIHLDGGASWLAQRCNELAETVKKAQSLS